LIYHFLVGWPAPGARQRRLRNRRCEAGEADAVDRHPYVFGQGLAAVESQRGSEWLSGSAANARAGTGTGGNPGGTWL